MPRKHLLNFKVTDAEHDLVRKLANRHGRNLSEEVRHALALYAESLPERERPSRVEEVTKDREQKGRDLEDPTRGAK